MSQTYKRQEFCPNCNSTVLAERQSGMSDGMGCLLIVLTGGLFLPIFILARMKMGDFRAFMCPRCGSALKAASSAKGVLVLLVVLAILIMIGCHLNQ